MTAIVASKLKKYYRIYKKEPGLTGSIKSLFFRKYEKVNAVEDLNFRVEQGELVGFIGPNGAGKTTTLKCLSGLLHPDEGFVSVLGFNPWQRKSALLRQIAFVMGQKNQLWWDLPPMETFLLNKEIYSIPKKEFDKTLTELINLLEVADVLKVQTRKLSLGERMKCELISALLHKPKVLFLDEPTIGLDVIMQKKVRDFIKTYNHQTGATIILTSHYMADVQELAKRVIIINKGRIIFDGQLSEIVKKYADHKLISVIFSKNVLKSDLKKIAKVKTFSPLRVVLMVKKNAVSSTASQVLKKFPVDDLDIEEPPIEEIIRELFTGKDYS